MALYLDSADINEACEAAGLGFVKGATTNPKSLVAAGHKDFFKAMEELCPLLPGTVFYQFTSHTLEEMREEYKRFRSVAPNLGFKIPATLVGMQMAKEISRESIVAITAVFDPAQAFLAAQTGARFIIPYVNRITRYTGSGPDGVANMVFAMQGTQCEVLAAGIKTSKEAVDTLLAGAGHLTMPLQVIADLAENTLTQQAVGEFDEVIKGL